MVGGENIAFFRLEEAKLKKDTFCRKKSIMKLLKRALRLNNEGVQHLLEYRDEEAEDCFTRSLTRLKNVVSFDESEGDLSFTDESEPTFVSVHQATHSIPHLHDPVCFIYGNAITLNLEDESILQDCEKNIHLYSSVVLLNIAMTYHRRAILNGSSVWRIKAESIYDMVIKIVDCVEAYQGTALLTKIAAINNLSQLCHGEGDYESSRDGFEYLGELLKIAEAQLDYLTSQDDIVTGMVLNIMLATAHANAPAA